MDEAANAGAAMPAPKSMLSRAVEHFLDLFHLRTPATTQQVEAAENAYLLKARNAHRFAPRHPPHPLSAPDIRDLPGASVFVTANPRFKLNLCVIRRGIDAKTARAMARGTKRDKTRGYDRTIEGVTMARAMADQWSAEKQALGLGLLPVRASWAK